MTKPPFSGSIAFKLTIRAFDVSVVRKAMVTYTYTPTWSYYHVHSREERTGDSQLDFGLSLLAIPRSDRHRVAPPLGNEPYWLPVGPLLSVGVLRTGVYDELHARIDAAAMAVNRRNRINAGLSVQAAIECI
jgi:hypothetical protein